MARPWEEKELKLVAFQRAAQRIAFCLTCIGSLKELHMLDAWVATENKKYLGGLLLLQKTQGIEERVNTAGWPLP